MYCIVLLCVIACTPVPDTSVSFHSVISGSTSSSGCPQFVRVLAGRSRALKVTAHSLLLRCPHSSPLRRKTRSDATYCTCTVQYNVFN